jgi:hypothetical protein
MLDSLRQLDDLLRGKRTAPQLLAGGRIDIPLRLFTVLAVVLGVSYGFFMGWYALSVRSFGEACLQLIATIIKVPALFLFTLVVTFPSLYVFNALIGCRLTFGATLRLLVGAIVVNLAVAASLGPILGFFTVSTTSYPFMVLLNVVLLGIGGLIGLAFLLQTLRRMALQDQASRVAPPPPAAGEAPADASAVVPPREPALLEPPAEGWPDQVIGSARSIFRVWVIIYALVGAQMGWILRPFIGSPNLEFTWFRPRSGNFFQAVVGQLAALFDVSR